MLPSLRFPTVVLLMVLLYAVDFFLQTNVVFFKIIYV